MVPDNIVRSVRKVAKWATLIGTTLFHHVRQSCGGRLLHHGTGHRPWLTELLARRPTKVAAIALANKIARMAWAMMARSERYREPAALAA